VGIRSTTDSGRHWTALPAPPTTLVTFGRHDGISQLRFADPSNGFAFGPQLWVTHDGGHTWQRSSLAGHVGELAAARGYVYAVTDRGEHHRLVRSRIGHDGWRALPAPKTLLGGLWAQGDHLFAQDSYGHDYIGKHLLYSLDGGLHWRQAPLPSPGLSCQFDQVKPPVLWERCNTGMLAHVWVSDNNGRTFHDPTKREGVGEYSNGVVFAAASNTVALVAYQELQRTTDTGRSYSTVGPTHLASKSGDFIWTYLGFTDPRHGVAVGAPNDGLDAGQLWITANAGKNWRRIAIHR
jgi:photosystem II stability/assembly factor-like uncharacterized protein